MEEAAAAARAEEQAKLDAEMERRRKRVEQWQEQRRRLQEAEGGGGSAAGDAGAAPSEGAASAPAPAEGARGWTLEGDEEEEEAAEGGGEGSGDAPHTAPPPPAPPAPGAAPGAAPPGAAPSAPQLPPRADDGGGDDDGVDPLDAFMAAQVLPEVDRLRGADAAAAAAVAAAAGEGGAAEAMEVTASHAPPAVEVPPPPDASPPDASRIVRPAGFKGLQIKVGGGAANGHGAGAGGGAGAALSVRPRPAGARPPPRRGYGGDDEGSSSSSEEDGSAEEEDDAEWARKAMAGKASKSDKLGAVDHAAANYAPFRKAFYIESAEVGRMSDAEVAALRKGVLDGVKCRGKDVPRPVRTWTQAGLSQKVLDVLRKLGHEKPMPIQAQALPVIMAGRDCIGIAKTGSGKTLAFLLPLLRHAKDQRPLAIGDGPIGLIMAPTRELVTQIAKDCRRFGAAVGLATAAVYGGSGVAAQIGELKRGAEVVVATPGRLIDILASSNGRATNLRRVTYLVLDEADRMFDMGFEPQISRLIANTRPDRQTVMFSATFPHAMELLARSALTNPVEISIGGRSVVNPDIEQYIEIRPESERFLRLLQLLGQWYEEGKILVFVHTQEKCDTIFRDLLRAGYPCLSLHGGKEQSDRESTISDFKSDVCNVLVATSVAARGLDVKSLRLVVNYDVPNHHEDYVHRCGRTGRAGAKGTAVTFIGPDEERFAPDLAKALKESGRPVPADLAAMADSFARKRRDGSAQAHGSGFGGSGFKFDLIEDGRTKADRKAMAIGQGLLDATLVDEDDEEAGDAAVRAAAAAAAAAAALPADDAAIVQTRGAGAGAAPPMFAPPPSVPPPAPPPGPPPPGAPPAQPHPPPSPLALPASAAVRASASVVASNALALVSATNAAAAAAAARAAAHSHHTLMPIGAAPVAAGPICPPPPAVGAAALHAAAAVAAAMSASATPQQRVAAFAASLNAAQRGGGAGGAAGSAHFETEIEINDFPQHARWKVTHKDSLREVADFTGAAITTRGQYIPPGRPVGPSERKLYLLVEGTTERAVAEAKQRIREVLVAAAAKEAVPGGSSFGGGGGGVPGGRYSVV